MEIIIICLKKAKYGETLKKMEETLLNKYFKREYFIVSGLTLLITTIVYYIYKKNMRIRVITDLPRNYLNLTISGIVTSISDGDGFKFLHVPFLRSSKYKNSDQKLSIRLAGVDAPETRHHNIPEQPFAKEAKQFLSSLVLNKTVELEILGIDRYNRVLAIVFIGSCYNQINVNLKIVEEGYACVYRGSDGVYGSYKNEMNRLEEYSKAHKLGMWLFQNTLTPMEFKKLYRSKKPLKHPKE